MEYLESVLRYKFWISFGAAILLPAVGWWLATGSMSAEVNKRWKIVDTNFKKEILKDSKIATIPNDKYIQGIKGVIKERTSDLDLARSNLRDSQKQYMVWPPQVSDAMAGAGYRQPPTDPDAPFKYGNVYRQELERIRKILNPYDELTKKGVVYAREGILPQAHDEGWSTMGPPIDRMWDAQEDIWLLTSIMQAIAAVNKDATSIIDAPIKAVQEVALRGGSKVTPTKPTKGAAGDNAPPPPTSRAAAAGPVNLGDVNFNPSEEFGPELVIAPPTKTTAATSDGEEDDKGARKRKARGDQKKRDRAAESGKASGPVAAVQRYIDGSNTSPHKTRGFYLRVAMDHTFVPELVAQLSNMPWPTEIVRVHQSDQVSRTVVAGRIEGGAVGGGASAPASPPGFGGGAARGRAGNAISFGSDNDREEEEAKTAEEAKQLLESPTKKAGLAGSAAEKDLVGAALDDPYVGMVVIAGTMTIYKPTDTPAKPQAAPQQTQPKPAEAPQSKPPGQASPAAKQGGAPQNQGQPVPNAATVPSKPAGPPKASPTPQQPGNQQPKQDNTQGKGGALPKPSGNPASPAPKKQQPKADDSGKKTQSAAPAKPPAPGVKK